MLYLADSLPRATRQDLAAAHASADPRAFMEGQIAELTKIIDWCNGEITKWQTARDAVAAFGPDTAGPAPDLASAHPSGTSARPKTRRAALMSLFREQPDREWRTRELAAELAQRGWAGASGNEANKVSRNLAQMIESGDIHCVRKGLYRLGAQPPEARPQTLEEAIE